MWFLPFLLTGTLLNIDSMITLFPIICLGKFYEMQVDWATEALIHVSKMAK